ncbi:MAG: ATP/GTP-binding protein [Thaumarchaeota archaeon]|nr:ATP/GTP-binding protein [Nitrososphaerota archaeon]
MYIIFITGMAGSGKSLFSKTLSESLDKNGWTTGILNTDAATINLPYEPVSDMRNFIDIHAIGEQYGLGSNGTMIFAADLLASFLPKIQEELDALQLDYLIVDTPGQMELFAYRESGKYLIDNLQGDGKMSIFISDSFMMSTSLNFLSIKVLALSVMLRLGTYSIHILNKVDMDPERAVRVIEWDKSITSIESELGDQEHAISYMKLYRELRKNGLMKDLLPVSALTGEGLNSVTTLIADQFTSGEEIKQ